MIKALYALMNTTLSMLHHDFAKNGTLGKGLGLTYGNSPQYKSQSCYLMANDLSDRQAKVAVQYGNVECGGGSLPTMDYL